MSEHNEQTTFFGWVKLNREYAPEPEVRKAMKLCYAVPNGAKLEKIKDKRTGKIWSPIGKKLKAEGLTKGILDINLDWTAWDNDLYQMVPGLRIEMKFGKNKLSPEQKEKKELLEEAGYKVAVCYSASQAVRAVFEYLPFGENDYQGIREFLQ